MKKLNELSDGSCGRVVAINGDAHFQSRVTSIGLTIGCPFEVIQNPKKRPVLVYARDTMVAFISALDLPQQCWCKFLFITSATACKVPQDI